MKISCGSKVLMICRVLLLFSISFSTIGQESYDSAKSVKESDGLQLLRITPAGENVPKSTRQIVFSFNQPVVAIGEMARDSDEIPISISPQINCEWRWLDTRSLSCQLRRENELKLATEYSIVVKPGIVASDGSAMSEELWHSFITETAKILDTSLHDWSQSAKPVVNVYFTQPVTKSTVLETIYFGINDKERIDSLVDEMFNPLSDAHFRQASEGAPFVALPAIPLGSSEQSRKAALDKVIKERGGEHMQARSLWRISPAQDLPADTRVTIMADGRINSIYGDQAESYNKAVDRFQTLPEFRFLGVQCYAIETRNLLVIEPRFTSDDVLNGRVDIASLDQCDPLNQVSLVFSSPVSLATAEAGLTITPDLAGDREDYKPWRSRNDRYALSSFFARRFNGGSDAPYLLTLPERLKAYQQYSVLSNNELVDELGRSLTSEIDMSFLTSHRAPHFVHDYRHSVLEKNIESELPIMVTNLDTLKVENYSRTTADQRQENLKAEVPLSDVQDIAYKVPLGVRKLLDDQSGVIVGTLNSDPVLTHYYRDHHRFISQVTPFQVHFKLGHFNSYVWVTDLSTGQPVADAFVRLESDRYSTLTPFGATEGVVKTDKDGLAILPGLVEVDPDLSLVRAYRYEDERLMVKVVKDDDFAVLPLENSYRAWSKVWPHLKSENSYSHAWGMTAQGVYKAGDTIQYKIFLRDHDNNHWIAPRLPSYELEVIDPKGQTIKREKNVLLSEFGSFSGEFQTSESAAVGWYQFRLTATKDSTSKQAPQSWLPMQVLVTDFTPAPFRVTTQLNADQFAIGDKVTVTTRAKMHAGGPYADAQSEVSAILYPQLFTSSHPLAKDFSFTFKPSNSRRSIPLHSSNGMVNREGELVADFMIDDPGYQFGRISVESFVRDDRGKSVADRASASFVGRDRFVGLRNTDWVHDVDKKTAIEHLVVDASGLPVAGTKVNILVERSFTRAARVKGAGNAYLTQYSTEWVKVSDCAQTSTEQPMLCEFVPDEPGNYRLTASIKDSAGRDNNSQVFTWVVGDGAVVWGGKDNHQIEIVPDAQTYKSGDVAKFLIKNPYPGAQALITVERYGVRRHWRKVLDGATPVIEIPIEADDYPGIYVSVLISSPRVAKPLGEGEVDLGKPSFKMGYVAVPIHDESKQISIDVKTDRDVYKPREKVTVSLKAKPVAGKRVPMELAVVVVDEAVFDLNKSGRSYYDPHAGFNRLEELGVANYNLLMKLVGRQKFEKKGADVGGGGGDADLSLRNIEKFVAYWNPSVEIDNKGRAKLDFKLPDNLTAWRVLVMAVSKEDQMGLGDATFKVNRPTEIRPIMPNQLTEGDVVQAGFSVMNRTDKARKIKVELRAVGSALGESVRKTAELDLAAFARQRVWIPVTAKNNGELAFFASAGDSFDQDAMEHHVPVAKRRSLVTAASYGTSTADSVSENIKFPDGVYSDVGGLNVQVAPSVVANVAGAFRYLKDYPYRCWEQRLSKALAASQYKALKDYLPADLRWTTAESTTEQALQSASAFQAPNGGMTYWVNDNNNVSPYLSAYTALGFAWLHDQGHELPKDTEDKLHEYLLSYLRAGRSDNGNLESLQGLRASIQSVALAALAKRGKLSVSEVSRYERLVPDMDLFGKAHFLQAATNVGMAENKLLALSETILSYGAQSAGKFQFSERVYSGAQSMLHTPMRTNCAILTSFTDLAKQSAKAMQLIGDVPFKQVRSITQARAGQESWANTQENLFCLNALRDYSQLYEQETPNMRLLATLNFVGGEEQKFGSVEFLDLQDEPVLLENPEVSVAPGLSGKVTVTKEGRGRFYYGVRMSYAKTDDNAERINAGLEVRREYSVQREGAWTLLETPLQLQKGDLVRVDLFVSSSTARHFVVVDDPVPGGLEPVNRDLATTSQEQASYSPNAGSWWHSQEQWIPYGGYGSSFYHQELRHDSTRFYADYLPAGNYHLSYTSQVIAGGQFSVLPVKAHEMYEPDVFGLGLPANLQVERSQP